MGELATNYRFTNLPLRTLIDKRSVTIYRNVFRKRGSNFFFYVSRT